MKNMILTVSALLSVLLFESAAGGLIAHYELNGNGLDSSGNNIDGIAVGNVDYTAADRFGNSNSAIKIGDGNSYIQIANNPLLDLQVFSIAAWVAWDSLIGPLSTAAGPGETGGIFNNGLNVDHYGLTAGDGFIRSWINHPNEYPASEQKYVGDANTLGDEDFHHLVATYNGSQRRLWFDGVLLSEVAFSQVIDYSIIEDSYIGMNFPGGDDWFPGVIDDVQIYNHALSSTEIQQLAAHVPEPATLTLFGLGIIGIHLSRRKRAW